ncbi:MAG TPA: hypothetical protein VH092_38950 [Urbifossiella sp.]|jgi:hypothetical protein|nr:hypothetical protein [Urbifossiella sp.]
MSRLTATAAALLLATPVGAAGPLPEKEVAAVRAVVEGTIRNAASKDWAGYAKQMDPAGLKTFRDDWVPLLTSAAKDGREKELLTLFAGARDAKAVLAYTPEEFFARFMKGATAHVPLLPGGKAEVLGVVAEGPDRAHAVVRTTAGPAASSVEVMSVRKVDGVWRTELPRPLAAVAAGLRMAGGVDTRTTTDEIPPERPNP